jgi:protein required for attachment to host cells
MIWITVATSYLCRIYQYQKFPQMLHLIKEMEHPESKEKESDLVSDVPGHYNTPGFSRGIYQSRSSPKEIVINQFASEVAKELETGRVAHEIKSFVLIAGPYMLGLVKHHLNKHVQALMIGSVAKDLHLLTEKELLSFLHNNWLEITSVS